LGKDIYRSSNIIIDDDTDYNDINIVPMYGELPNADDQIAIPYGVFVYMLYERYYDYITDQKVVFEKQDPKAFWEHLQNIDFRVVAEKISTFPVKETFAKIVGVFDTPLQVYRYYDNSNIAKANNIINKKYLKPTPQSKYNIYLVCGIFDYIL